MVSVAPCATLGDRERDALHQPPRALRALTQSRQPVAHLRALVVSFTVLVSFTQVVLLL